FKGGTPPLVGEPVARESSGLHHRRAHPHACLALVGSSVPARPLSVRPKRTHLRYPQTTGHDRPQPSERGIALIAIYYVYAKELASQKPPIFKTGVNRHLIVCGLSTEADNTIVRFLCRSSSRVSRGYTVKSCVSLVSWRIMFLLSVKAHASYGSPSSPEAHEHTARCPAKERP